MYRKKIFCNDVLILLGTTLHRLKPCAMLFLRLKTAMHRNKSSIMYIIFWDSLILYQIFFSPQVKQSMILSNKHGIHQLPHKLPNDLRFGSQEIRKENLEIFLKIRKSVNFINYNPVTSLPPRLKVFSILAENCWKIKTKVLQYCTIWHEN